MSATHAGSSATTITLDGVAATNAFAKRCAISAHRGDVFTLSGGLGAGKTTFARGFVNAVAERSGAPAEEVPSPTFTLVQIYEFASETIYHFDLYRIDSEADTTELGLDDAFADGISLIEWPERLGTLQPVDRLDLAFEFGDRSDVRVCRVSGYGDWASRVEELCRNG